MLTKQRRWDYNIIGGLCQANIEVQFKEAHQTDLATDHMEVPTTTTEIFNQEE